MSWFKEIKTNSHLRIELNNGNIIECKYLSVNNGIVNCLVNGKIKKFKEDKIDYLDEINLTSEIIPKERKREENFKIISNKVTLINRIKDHIDEYFYSDIDRLFDYFEEKEINSITINNASKTITNVKTRSYIDKLSKSLKEDNLNVLLIIGIFLSKRIGNNVKKDLYCFFNQNKDRFLNLSDLQKDYYEQILKNSTYIIKEQLAETKESFQQEYLKIVEVKNTNKLKIVEKKEYKYDLKDIDTIKKLNSLISRLQQTQEFKELLLLANELLNQKISFEFKIRLLESKSQALNSLEKELEAEKVYESLVQILKSDDIHNDYKYENYLATLIGYKIKNSPNDVQTLLDELYTINSNSNSYQHFYKLSLDKGIIKLDIENEQKEFNQKINVLDLKKSYPLAETINKFKLVIKDTMYYKIKNSYIKWKKNNSTWSLKATETSILLYEINYQVIKHKNHINILDNILSEILAFNNKSYYEYYYLYPSSNNIIINDIYFSIKKQNYGLAYYAFEKLFVRNLLENDLYYNWYLYLKYFDTTKTLNPIKFQLNKYNELSNKSKIILYRSMLYILHKYGIKFKNININNITIEIFNHLFNLLKANIKIEASYERDSEQLEKPIYGYKKILEEYKEDFNYFGAYKYIEMISQILMNSNQDVVELKETYENYKNKLIKLQQTTYLPRNNSYYRKGLLSFYIEENIENTEKYLLLSLKKDEEEDNQHAFKEFIKIFKNIDFNLTFKIFYKYKDNYKINSIEIEKQIVELLYEQTKYEEAYILLEQALKIYDSEKEDETLLKLYRYQINLCFKLKKSSTQIIELANIAKIVGLSKKEYSDINSKIQTLNEQNTDNNSNKLKSILESSLYKKFVDIFKNYHIESSGYSLNLKVSTIEEEKFTIKNLEEVIKDIEESKNFENQAKFSITAYKVASKLESNYKGHSLVKNKEEYFIQSIVYSIRAYNFAKEYDKAILFSIFYFIYTGKDKRMLSVLNVYLHSILKQQTHQIDSPIHDSIYLSSMRIIDDNKMENIIKFLYAVGFNKQCKQKLLKKFNEKNIEVLLSIINTKFDYTYSNVYTSIDNFIKNTIDAIDENLKAIRTIYSYKLSDQSINSALKKINVINFIEIDKNFIKKFQKIIQNFISKINLFESFSEKNNFIKLTLGEIKDLQQQLKDNISLISYGLLNENLKILVQKLEIFEQDFIKETLPKFSINLPTNNQFTISNSHLSSEATNVLIDIKDSHGQKINDVYIPQILGSNSISKEIDIKDIHTSSLSFEITYNTLIKNEQQVKINLDINIEEEEFEYIDNVYRVGQEVKDKSMFMGRDLLIKKLSDDLQEDRINSVILYGQKRAGKSSTFFHLKEKLLNGQYIPIFFSMGKCDSLNEFIKAIVFGIEEYYEDSFDEDIFNDIGIDLKEINNIVYLIRFIKKSIKKINTLNGENKELILLLDEFTYIYGAIKNGTYSSTFMQNWKAMLEENIFKALLIGQDSMSQFLRDYPNEFGVIKQERITYLDKDSAKKLIVEPILLKDNSSRYIENSVDLILEYSACSPYFIQRICKEIVDILNQKKNNKITNLIVEKAIEEIINGHNSEKLEFFDNLYSLGSGENEQLKEKRLSILIQIAKNQIVESKNSYELLLKELIDNDVIVKNHNIYKIKVKLFESFLEIHYGNINE